MRKLFLYNFKNSPDSFYFENMTNKKIMEKMEKKLQIWLLLSLSTEKAVRISKTKQKYSNYISLKVGCSFNNIEDRHQKIVMGKINGKSKWIQENHDLEFHEDLLIFHLPSSDLDVISRWFGDHDQISSELCKLFHDIHDFLKL